MTNSTKLIHSAARSLEDFRAWLRLEIAKSADVGFVGAEFSLSLEEMGLSSVHAVRLSGEIEKLLGVELEPTFLYDFATVEELCQTLFRMQAGRAARAAAGTQARLAVHLAASFTAEPIDEAIRHPLSLLGFDTSVTFARYHQVFQELLNPHGLLATVKQGVSVLLVRIEDWFRFSSEAPSPAAAGRIVEDFLGGLRELAARSAVPLVVALAPHSPPAVRRLRLSDRLAALDERLIAGAGATPGVSVLDLRRVADDFRVAQVWDEGRDRLGHIPFTRACFTAMGASIARRVAALVLGPAKVIVLDCDNTLWGGVTGEDGPEKVRVDGPFAALQRFMVAQQESGKLLCLCSKNNEADVWATFDAHPEMPLARRHLVASRLDWQRKSDSIRALARELNLGLDSFVFVDDNPMEIDEVSGALPQVLCVRVPEDPAAIAAFFAHHWAFDSLAVTDEDRRRTEMYQQNRERTAVLSSSASFEDFLRHLEVCLDVGPLADSDLERASQLTHRTNQFTSHKAPRSEAELRQLRAEPGRHLWRVRVRDRFGDYGFVGLVSCVLRGPAMVCDLLLMSCRVLGRRAEHRMVRLVADAARAAGCAEVMLDFTPSDRNAVARAFLESLGPGLRPCADGRLAVRFAPGAIDAVLASARDQQSPPDEPAGAPAPAGPSLRAAAAAGFATIAAAGADIDALQSSIDATSQSHRPALATEYVTPRTAWQKKIAGIWREVLRIDRVGIYDSFFELGGDSLRAAEAFARMWDLGVPASISLQTVPDPTVAGLAQAIEDVKEGRQPTLLVDRFSLADEGNLAPDVRLVTGPAAAYDRPMRVVLLTGATGYLGAFLLRELLAQTDAEILCLVRAATPEDARQRILGNLRRFGLWEPAMAGRFDVVLGDLTEPDLGLDREAFLRLADRIDTILHSGAWVNFVYPYQHLKRTNVDSTETILRLATAAAPKPIQVHFVSTLGVIMSTGYGRGNLLRERDPLTHADDLLNGYEQTKYASDKMVWTAMKERGIPAAIYRPGMVSGLSDGTYQKHDEFLPQMLKGCLQLGSWPAVDTTWEMAPVDFVTRAIVHIAKRPQNLNKAYFTLHPRRLDVTEIIEWHRSFGYSVRGLPWDVWKRELLNLGTERLRKNALFPFVDFVRALSEEQVYFPPTDRSDFHAAIADMPFDLPAPLTLLERYTKHFIASGFYNNLPSGPRSKRPNERAPDLTPATGPRGDLLDERVRFDGARVDASEAYYIFWNQPGTRRQMVVRYVLHNGPIEEAKIAEVWCWFRDQDRPGHDVAVRQRYPLGRGEVINGPEVSLRIGPSGYGPGRAWGEVHGPDGTVSWDLTLDRSQGVGVNRLPDMEKYDLFPHFQSNGVRHRLSGKVTVNGEVYVLEDQLASDGHYWDTKNLRSWSWGHCSSFEGDADFLFEGIAPRFNDWCQPCTWLTFVYKGEVIRSNLIDSLYYNRETDATLTSWNFTAERGDLRFVCRLTARPEDQILIIHPLPDDEFLYTHITYCGDMVIDIERKEANQWWKIDQRVARRSASFEVTRKVRNPEVRREFRIVRA
jgi:FkbH-like protein/thioester reductase-like protein